MSLYEKWQCWIFLADLAPSSSYFWGFGFFGSYYLCWRIHVCKVFRIYPRKPKKSQYGIVELFGRLSEEWSGDIEKDEGDDEEKGTSDDFVAN